MSTSRLLLRLEIEIPLLPPQRWHQRPAETKIILLNQILAVFLINLKDCLLEDFGFGEIYRADMAGIT